MICLKIRIDYVCKMFDICNLLYIFVLIYYCICSRLCIKMVFIILDGIICEEGWVGFVGSCYWFEWIELSFFGFFDYCMFINVFLVLLNNEDVILFVSEFIKGR